MKQLAAKTRRASPDKQSRIDAFHQQRHERYQQKPRQPGPATTWPICSASRPLRHGQILWQQIGRAVESKADQEIAERTEREIAAPEKPRMDERPRRDELPQDKRAERQR